MLHNPLHLFRVAGIIHPPALMLREIVLLVVPHQSRPRRVRTPFPDAALYLYKRFLPQDAKIPPEPPSPDRQELPLERNSLRPEHGSKRVFKMTFAHLITHAGIDTESCACVHPSRTP